MPSAEMQRLKWDLVERFTERSAEKLVEKLAEKMVEKLAGKLTAKRRNFAANSSENSDENCWQFLLEYLASKIEFLMNKVTSQTYKFYIYRDFSRHTAEQTWTKIGPMKPEKRLPSVPSVGRPAVPPANASHASTQTHTYIISYIWIYIWYTVYVQQYPENPCLVEQIKQRQLAGGDCDKWQYNIVPICTNYTTPHDNLLHWHYDL